MVLVPGQRLEGAGRTAYVVGDYRAKTPWYQLYTARKVFFNYRYDDREFYEASSDEWVEVLIRVCGSSESETPADVEQRRKLLRYEAGKVLETQSGWFPEPLDWLEFNLDVSESDTNREPLLIMSCPQGKPLHLWRQSQPFGSSRCVQVAVEILDLFEWLHQRGQIVGAVGPDDFLIDQTGRLFFMATDRVLPANQSGHLRRFFPPERYSKGFAAPEACQATGSLDARSDLLSWAALSLFLIANESPAEDAVAENRDGPLYGEAQQQRLEEALTIAANHDLQALRGLIRPQSRGSAARMIAAWSTCLRACLAVDPAERPVSVKDCRRNAAAQTSPVSLGRLWRRLVGRFTSDEEGAR